MILQFVVEDIGRYNYNGEIQDKLLEMNKPNLITIKQKQVQHALIVYTVPCTLRDCALLYRYAVLGRAVLCCAMLCMTCTYAQCKCYNSVRP